MTLLDSVSQLNVQAFYLLYTVRVTHAIPQALFVADHSTCSTLERNFSPHLEEQLFLVNKQTNKQKNKQECRYE